MCVFHGLLDVLVPYSTYDQIPVTIKTKHIILRGVLAMHYLTHIFQHTLFDWLKFT